jgi:hypothetical protein
LPADKLVSTAPRLKSSLFAPRVLGWAALAFAVVFVAAAMAWTNVPTQPTADDRVAALQILHIPPGQGLPAKPSSFAQQIEFIRGVQNAVLRVAPKNVGIPKGHSREPRDLLEFHAGLCYDRSRSIEKLLRLAGFQVRHVFIVSANNISVPILALFISGHSHAMTEVRTARGWMLVGSNTTWIGKNDDGSVISIVDFARHDAAANTSAGKKAPDIIRNPFIYIYGLYSRHGDFYPPYYSVVDVNWREMLANL